MSPVDRQQKTIDEYMAKHVAPAQRAAKRFLATADGALIIDRLERFFLEDGVPKDNTGAVDANAVLINVGALKVIQYFRNLAKDGQDG